MEIDCTCFTACSSFFVGVQSNVVSSSSRFTIRLLSKGMSSYPTQSRRSSPPTTTATTPRELDPELERANSVAEITGTGTDTSIDAGNGRVKTRLQSNMLIGALCLAEFLGVSSASMLTVSLPMLSSSFFPLPSNLSSSSTVQNQSPGGEARQGHGGDIQWLLSAYAITFGALLLLFGRLSDQHSPRPFFVAGLVLFAISNIASFLILPSFPSLPSSPSLPVAVEEVGTVTSAIIFSATRFRGLIGSRVIQGLASAMFVPASTAILGKSILDPRNRGVALGYYASAGPLGLVTGFFIGGVISSSPAAGPRYVFLVSGVMGAVCAGIGWWYTRDLQHTLLPSKKIDFGGCALGIIGVVGITTGISQGANRDIGWTTPYVPVLFGMGMTSFILFFLWERYVAKEAALLPCKLWTKSFTATILVLVLTVCAFETCILQITFLLADLEPASEQGGSGGVGYGLDAFEIAVRMVPLAICGIGAGLVSGRFNNFVRMPKLVVAGALTCMMISFIPLFLLSDSCIGSCMREAGLNLDPRGEARVGRGEVKGWMEVILPALVIGPISFQFLGNAAFSILLGQTDVSMHGSVGAVGNTATQIGIGVGLAIQTAVIAAFSSTPPASHNGSATLEGGGLGGEHRAGAGGEGGKRRGYIAGFGFCVICLGIAVFLALGFIGTWSRTVLVSTPSQKDGMRTQGLSDPQGSKELPRSLNRAEVEALDTDDTDEISGTEETKATMRFEKD